VNTEGMDQDTTTTTGSEAAGLPAGRWNSPLEDVLCRELWQDKAAGWVEVSWRHVNELRADVAEMLALPPGPDLLLAVERVQRDLDAHGGHCSGVHTFNVWGPVGTPGNPCECQVITAAAWQAVASWTQFRADRHLVSTAGARPHQVPLGSDPDRPSAQVTDPGAEELALGLRASATGLRTRLNRARRRHDYPRLCAAVAAGCLPGWQADVLLDDLVNFPDPVVDAVLDSLLDTMADRRTQEKISWTLTVCGKPRNDAPPGWTTDPSANNAARCTATAGCAPAVTATGPPPSPWTSPMMSPPASAIASPPWPAD